MSQVEAIMGSKGAMIGLAIVAFLVAALLVLVIVRMLFGGRLRMPGGRARQARLGIVDAFDLDRQRQLIIVRRDNTEHLIMIGGPNDLLIESEIVRVEAREARDQRRDKDVGFQTDGRIPAPSPADPRPLDQAPALETRGDEPLLPMALPEMPQAAEPSPSTPPQAAGPPPARAPTFPLPPRRPPPMPERRPPLPMLPEGVSRDGDLAAGPAVPDMLPPGPPMMPPSVLPEMVPPSMTPPATNPAGVAAPPLTAPARTVPPPFLKPLPPRPPLRPLQRATPVPPPVDAPAPTTPKVMAPPPPPRPAPAPPQKPAAPPPPTAPESSDALESLEEEMAKLLGRGPG